MRTLKRSDYTVGWICALPLELGASMTMFDEEHTTLPSALSSDQNNYSLGKIGEHNVVMACLPAGRTGVHNAATVAAQMKDSFTSIKFSLMVGIGGGVPSGGNDVRLGDVVVSQPELQFGGVVQYDLGKMVADGRFERTGILGAPPKALLTALSTLRARHLINRIKFIGYLSGILPSLAPNFRHPGSKEDQLFEAEYNHIGGATCAQCDLTRLVSRAPRDSLEPQVHYGTIASGNMVMRDGKSRERLGLEYNVRCFEMEAAGLMNDFDCIVVRGICDYADTHKNKRWQPYAAVVAATYAKEFLGFVAAEHNADIPTPPAPNTNRSSAGTSNPQIDFHHSTHATRGGQDNISSPDTSSSTPIHRSGYTGDTSSHNITSSFLEFSLLTNECLEQDEVALGRLVLNLHAPADDYCPHSPILITRGEVSVAAFPGINTILSRKKSSITNYLARLNLVNVPQNNSVPEFVVRSARTSRLLNSGAFFERLIQHEDVKRWFESIYRKRDVYLAVGIHSFSDTPEASAVEDSTPKSSPFATPGNQIIGVRYRRVKLRGFRGSTVGSAFLDRCGRWKRYSRADPYRGNPEIDILEASLDDASPLEDLQDEYNDYLEVYYDSENGESFADLVTSHIQRPH
jgi:nucleoside phosphorylase